MNRLDLILKVAEEIDLPRTRITEVLDAILATIESSLKAGEDVRLTGFGSFSISVRKASTGRNPRTGQALQLAASRSVRFRPGKSLRDSVV